MNASAPSDLAASAEPLEPGLLRLIEALARAHVEEDYAAAQAALANEAKAA